MSEMTDEELAKLVRKAIAFSDWAAGEGICPSDEDAPEAPENFLFNYSAATGDEGWDTLADRAAARIAALVKERDEARADHEWMTANRNKWQDATTRARNEKLAAESRIASLEADVKGLKDAARPFVEVALNDISTLEDDRDVFRPMEKKYARAPRVTVGDLRRLATLAQEKTDERHG
jgi:hypothetical protein